MKRSLALLMVLAMVLSIAPMSVWAADGTENTLEISGVTISAKKGSKGSIQSFGSDGDTVTVVVKSHNYGGGDFNFSVENTSGSIAIVSFHYSGTNYGSWTLPQSGSGDLEMTMQPGEGYSFTVTMADDQKRVEATIVLSNITVNKPSSNSTVTVLYDNTLGTVTAAGMTDTDEDGTIVAENVGSDGVALTASPAEGVTFLGWMDTDTNMMKSTKAEDSVLVTGDTTLRAVFAHPDQAAWFKVGNYYTNDLSKAVTVGSPVILAASGTLPAGDYEIPQGVTLLLPYSEEDLGTDPETVEKDDYRPKGNVYRKLTVAEGAKVAVNGTLLVNAKLGASDYEHQGSIGSDYGLLELNGTMAVNEGGALKVRGMLTGSGSITAHSGGEIWQAYEMGDWPGGSAAVAMNNKGEFPITQYYFQRIQVNTTYEYGSSMSIFAYVYVPSEGNALQANVKNLVGPTEDSFFKMGEGSTVVMTYQKDLYKTEVAVEGSVEIRSLKLNVGTYSLGTEDTVFPIPASFMITVKKDATAVITEDLKLMTGTILTIETGATVTVQEGTALYLYGVNNYDQPRRIPSSSDVTELDIPTVDSFILNNGTLNILGEVHTSTPDTKQITGEGEVTNPDNIILGTVGQTLISYDANGGTGSMESHFVEPGQTVTLPANGFTREGYNFQGWTSDPSGQMDPFQNTERLIEDQESITLPKDFGYAKQTLYAVWEAEKVYDESEYAAWRIGGTTYTGADSFKNALAAATSGTTIVLAKSGVLAKGDYTIPSGVKVLLPHDGNAAYNENPVSTRSYTTPSDPYSKLTLARGTTIKVYGQLNVSSLMFSGGGGSTTVGSPSGRSAQIVMAQDTSINVMSGGKLFAYGFITGQGEVVASSGSTIHELFQLCEHRGGSAMMNMTTDVFPLTQYYVQNIEAKLTYMAGCTEILHTDMYLMDQTNPCHTIPFIGSGSGLFQMGSGAKIVRQYHPDTERVTMDVDGNITLGSTTITVYGTTIDSSKYILPLTSVYTINIHSGTTTIQYRAEFLPGVQMTIDQGATLKLNNKFWVYDVEDWVGKSLTYGGADLIPVAYSPTRTKTRTSADLTDASINVNGKIYVGAQMYTTAGGAKIYSSAGTGEVYFAQSPNNYGSEALRYNSSNVRIGLPATSARLLNSTDGETITSEDGQAYTETDDDSGDNIASTYYPAGTTFSWCSEHDRWETGAVTVTFKANGGNGTDQTVQNLHTPGKLPSQTGNFSRANLHLKGWNTAANGSGEFVEDGGLMKFYQNTVLYAQWQGNVTWADSDGNTLSTDAVDLNAVPAYGGETPTKAADAQYVYTFAGWSTTKGGAVLSSIPAMTGDVTYYAVFTGETLSYTVTWKDWDGTVLETDKNVPYGATPEYNGVEPSKRGDSGSDYSRGWVFTGWSPAVAPVTGDVTYTAQFEEVLNYVVYFYSADGSTQLNKIGVRKGTVPTEAQGYTEPTAPSGQTFLGWTTTIGGEPLETLPECTGSVIYYAVFGKGGSGLEGDINGDNVVDIIDLNRLLANYNKSGENLEGDINSDKVVDIIDLNKLLANYNKSAS